MTNVEKLKHISLAYLGDIRERLGAETRDDETYDDIINDMSNHRIVKEWCAWTIGDGNWWTDFKGLFDDLEKLSK